MNGIQRRVRSWFVCFAVITIFLMLDTAVLADDDIPGSCTGTYGKMAYEAGKSSGENIVSMAWSVIDDCDRIEYLEFVVVGIADRLTLPEYASQVAVCRYAGYMNGMMDEIDATYRQCEAPYDDEGEIIGYFSGKAYCALSLAMGGLAGVDEFIRGGPVPPREPDFSIACEVAFDDTTITYCEEYTEKWDLNNAWDQVRINQCGEDIVIVLPPFTPKAERRQGESAAY